MASPPVATALLCLLAAASAWLAACQPPQPHGLRGRLPANVTAPELRELVLSFVEPASADLAPRLRGIEQTLAPTFDALPKNEVGSLTPRAARYLVHHYFAKQHGWLIAGLEPHGMRDEVSQVHEVAVLRDRVPALIEELLDGGRMEAGLSLQDVSAVAALLERLLMNEAARVLERAYEMNGHTTDASLDEASLHEVVTSYLLMFHRTTDDISADEHRLFKELAQQGEDDYYSGLAEFGHDMVRNFIYARRHRTNPFTPQLYSFELAAQIVDALVHRYGRWQNAECTLMKEDLMEIEADGTGLVPLSRFYGHSSPHGYLFHESTDYLRQIGALEEGAPGRPHVRIVNYLLGPSNCVASSPYLSVCCLSECEALMGEVEGRLRAPAAAPGRLLDLVATLSSSTVDAPRVLSQDLQARLHAIAEKSGGEVPLHGRLFAQWLHLAFPRECPFPHIVEDAAVLAADHFDPERHAFSEEARLALANATAPEAVSSAPQWSDEEVLPLSEPPRRSAWGDVGRVVVLLSLGVAVLGGGFRSVSDAVAAGSRRQPGKKSELPLYA